MAKLTLNLYPAPVLQKKATKIKNPLDAEVQKIIPEMIQVMKKQNGVGLAAPQVGVSVRLCLVQEDDKVHVLINPCITAKSTKKIMMEEGC